MFNFGKLGTYNNPIKAAMLFGHHRDLSLGRVFMSYVVLDAARIFVSFKFFQKLPGSLKFFQEFLDRIVVRQQQRLIRRPNVVGNPYDLKMQVLYICITYHCNRNCSFCYSRGLQEEFKEHMSLANFEFAARWAKSQGWTRLKLLGGEPTIHPEFKAIVETAGKLGFTLTFGTNGLFDPGLNSSFNKERVIFSTFSYPQEALPPREMEIFHKNVKRAVSERGRVMLSWVIQPGNDGWRQVVDLAKRFRTRATVRFGMVLPGHRKQFGPEEFRQKMQGLAKQIIDIAHYAYENHVLFFFYRTLLPCMFSREQLGFLRSINPFLFYTRCPLCLRGEYDCDLRLTINPDLSCYPCPAVSAKGIKLTPGATRESVNKLLAPLMRQITAQPLMDSCRTCRFFANYQRHLEDKLQDLADKTACQGGCFQYRQCKSDCASGIC